MHARTITTSATATTADPPWPARRSDGTTIVRERRQEGGQGVRRVVVERMPGPVIAAGGARIGMPGAEDEPLCPSPSFCREQALTPGPEDHLALAASLDLRQVATIVELAVNVDFAPRPDDVVYGRGQNLRSTGAGERHRCPPPRIETIHRGAPRCRQGAASHPRAARTWPDSPPRRNRCAHRATPPPQTRRAQMQRYSPRG